MMSIKDRPEAIMINVPQAFFKESMSEAMFTEFYQRMNEREGSCFHHFISGIPVHEVLYVYICFGGQVRFRANIALFTRNGYIETHTGRHGPRNWMTTCAPVITAPRPIAMKGFRGFRYSELIF